jgi:hypothetical protein
MNDFVLSQNQSDPANKPKQQFLSLRRTAVKIYHRAHSASWVIRLRSGQDQSNVLQTGLQRFQIPSAESVVIVIRNEFSRSFVLGM